MLTRLMTGAVVFSMLAAPAAFADSGRHNGWRHDDDDDYRYQRGGYDYARVVDVDPIIRRVRVEIPRRECWTETRYEEPAPRPGLAGPTIVGGLIGGAIGHQFGSGDGKRAATVAGAVIGSVIGHETGARRQAAYSGYDEPRAYDVERCDTRVERTFEDRI